MPTLGPQAFGHLMWRVDPLEKTLMLGKTEGRRRRGWQSTKQLDRITDSMGASWLCRLKRLSSKQILDSNPSEAFLLGFPRGSEGKVSAGNAGVLGSIPGWGRVGKTPWRRKWQPTPVLLPRNSHGQRSPVGYSPWGWKESDMTEHLHFSSRHQWTWVSANPRR